MLLINVRDKNNPIPHTHQSLQTTTTINHINESFRMENCV